MSPEQFGTCSWSDAPLAIWGASDPHALLVLATATFRRKVLRLGFEPRSYLSELTLSSHLLSYRFPQSTTPAYFARADELPLARGGWGLSVDTQSCSANSPVGEYQTIFPFSPFELHFRRPSASFARMLVVNCSAPPFLYSHADSIQLLAAIPTALWQPLPPPCCTQGGIDNTSNSYDTSCPGG